LLSNKKFIKDISQIRENNIDYDVRIIYEARGRV
jgi:hypothetical protein